MSLSERLAAENKRALKAGAAAVAPVKAKAAKAEGEEDEEEMAEGEDEEDQPDAKKAKGKKAAKAKPGKKAESEDEEETAEGEDDEEEMAARTAADPGTVAELCADAGVPKMAKSLINAKLPLGKVKAKIAGASGIRKAFEAGKRICRTIDPARAEAHIEAGNSIAHVKAELFDQIVKAEGPEIRNSQTGGSGAGAAAPSGSFGWDKTVEKLNARHG